MGYTPRTDEEWAAFHAFRAAGIGGSEAPIVMKASPWSTPLELWLRKRKLIKPQPQTWPMRRGVQFEPLARAAYELLTGIPMKAKQVINSSRPELRGNFDGINEEIARSLEIKCPGKDDHEMAKRKIVPPKYIWQLRHLTAAVQHEEIDYFSFEVRGLESDLNALGWQRLFELLSRKEIERRSALIVVKRDREKEGILLEQEAIFWKHVLSNVPPPLDLPKETPKTEEHTEIFKTRKNRNRTVKAKKCPHCKRAVISGAKAHTHCERIHARKNFQLTLIKGVPK
jgi:putative phage-type endonuclease